jgi:hypothetical protein
MMSIYGTGPFYNPLFFAFPDDYLAYENVTYNIMIGPSFKLGVNSDTLDQDETTFYFPAGLWCNIFNVEEPCVTYASGQMVTLPSKAADFYLHLYEGNIVPLQNATALGILNTKQL